MFLASYNPIEVAHPSTTASMASVPVPIVDDDEQTDCEASVSGTPRGPGIFSLQSSLFQGYVCPLCREIAKFFKGTWVGHVGLPWFAMFCCEILSVCVSINVCHMQRVICDSCGTWMNLDHDHPGSNSLGMHTITTMERPRPGPTRLSSYMAAAFQPKLQV